MATKRQLRNLKIVRDHVGQLFVFNTKTLKMHAYSDFNSTGILSREELLMIKDVAQDAGVFVDKGYINRHWSLYTSYVQIRL